MEEKIQNLLSENKATDVTEINLDGCSGPFKFHCLQQFSNLEYLSLKNSSISSLRGFPKLPNLQKLDLSNNKLSSTIFFLHGCPQMTHLNLSNNKIKDISALKTLGKLKNLQSLLLVNCEIAHTPEYRKRIFHMIKNLKDLDGEDKTMEDAVLSLFGKESEQKNDSVNGSNPKKGKKRKMKSTDSPQKKSKFLLPQKNALMQLNELKPGLKYVVESISGPAHNPNFVVSVEVNGYNYKGHGNSKQLAKHAAAQLALASFVQYSDTPKAIIALNQSVEAIDFTTDVRNEAFSFNEPEQHKNGSDIQLIEPSLKNSIPKKLTEAAKKNPVMLLNEIHPGLDYKLIEENSSIPSQRFCMSVEIDGVTYEGTGPNKKQAKASAARSVLSNLYKVSYNMQGLSQSIPNSFDAELYNFPQAVADTVSKLLLSTFKEIMTGNAEHAKWKIIASY
ncbi:double-stranded RNA-specific editase 1 [Caerostris extrusa]|uniref:Double-stranded RNA-specific editase 1 n=1 Tax=Caerostris extrusa TaxID=172846 RepID=A0AAV4XKU9_CAEEX|nr:double-stranded RNA-specific editase 1 [Caerostris extrusa]